MNAPAAFKGTFVNFRPVSGRKVYQFVVEVPVEQANAALEALGGVPDPANPAWVAVARLDRQAAAPEKPKTLPAPDDEGRKWGSLKLAQQAGIRCGDPAFIRFLIERHGMDDAPNRDAAQFVRHLCKVESRAEFDEDEAAGDRWRRLDWVFRRWVQEPSFQ